MDSSQGNPIFSLYALAWLIIWSMHWTACFKICKEDQMSAPRRNHHIHTPCSYNLPSCRRNITFYRATLMSDCYNNCRCRFWIDRTQAFITGNRINYAQHLGLYGFCYQCYYLLASWYYDHQAMSSLGTSYYSSVCIDYCSYASTSHKCI